MAKNNGKPSFVRRWHRSLGVVAAIFVLFMVISGLALNHSHTLGLDRSHVSQPALLDWYGLDGPQQFSSFAFGDNWLSMAGSQLYFNDKFVATITDAVTAVKQGEILIAAGSEELLLLDNNGNLIERLTWNTVTRGRITALGLLPNGLVVIKSGKQLWQAGAELLDWQPIDQHTPAPSWSKPQTAPEALQWAITQQYRGDGLSMERFLLDAHSGRLFGSVGVLIYDILAVSVGFLAVSGLVLWVRGRRNGRRNGNGNGRGNGRRKQS